MGDTYRLPKKEDLLTPESFGSFFGDVMHNPTGPTRTSAGASGNPQYVATAVTVSDILQGSLNYRNPEEIMATTNIALASHLQKLDTAGMGQLSLLGRQAGGSTPGRSPGQADDSTGGGSGAKTLPNDPNDPKTSGNNTPDEMRFAGARLADHRNFLMDTDASGGKQVDKQLRDGFGFDSRVADMVSVKDGAKSFWLPNLINCLWHLCENGFILATSGGAAGFKHSKNGNISQHSWGGAIDIMAIGRESDGAIYPIVDAKSHSIVEEMYILIEQMSDLRIPTEVGGPLDSWNAKPVFYSNADHKNHLHIGYAYDRPGLLLGVLKPTTTTPPGVS